MGGSVSSGRDNDELTDNLIDCRYITTKKVENVFRTVDRGNYYLTGRKSKVLAYMDSAWREGNLHLSAPGIYSKAVEALDLKRGHSFLNMGSGTGYLSTMVGLILGCASTSKNHGIEYHADVIEYAIGRLEDFILTCPAFDEYEFCPPLFVQGNCLKLSTCMKYDRIYCGGECHETEHLELVKSLMNLDGVAIVPFNSRLLRIHKKSDGEYRMTNLMSVSFAILSLPIDVDVDIEPPESRVELLKSLCRASIRSQIRKNIKIWKGDLNITRKPRERESAREQRITRLQIIRDLAGEEMVEEEEPELMEQNMAAGLADSAELAAPVVLVDHAQPTDPVESLDPLESVELADRTEQSIPAELAKSAEPADLDQEGIGMAVFDAESAEILDTESHVTSASQLPLGPLPAAANGIQEKATDGATNSSTPGECADSGMASDGQPEYTDEAQNSPSKCSDCEANQQAGGSSCNLETEVQNVEHDVLERPSPVPSNHSEDGNHSGEDFDDRDDVDEPAAGEGHLPPNFRAGLHAYMLPSNQPDPSSEDDQERQHNRDKANLYHSSFADAMASKIMSLPLPTSLHHYLLYYRNLDKNGKTVSRMPISKDNSSRGQTFIGTKKYYFSPGQSGT